MSLSSGPYYPAGAVNTSPWQPPEPGTIGVILSGFAVTLGASEMMSIGTTLLGFGLEQTTRGAFEVLGTLRGFWKGFAFPSVLGILGIVMGIRGGNGLAVVIAVLGPFLCLMLAATFPMIAMSVGLME